MFRRTYDSLHWQQHCVGVPFQQVYFQKIQHYRVDLVLPTVFDDVLNDL